MMKRRLFLFVALLLASIAVNAQFFFGQWALMTPHYNPGEVYFKDGHHEEFFELEVPRFGKSKLEAKKSADEKGYTDIDAADIIGIKIWNKDFPDKQHVLYYLNARKSMGQSLHQWGQPIMGSAWGVVYQCEQYYVINKNTGDLEVIRIVGNMGETPTLYYLLRSDSDKADLVMYNGSFSTIKRTISKLFAEKPEIAEAIKKGKLKGSDMQYILDQMAEGKEAVKPAITIPQTQVDATSNGVVGDDE